MNDPKSREQSEERAGKILDGGGQDPPEQEMRR